MDRLLMLWQLLHPLWPRAVAVGGAVGWLYGAYEWLRRRRAEKRAQGPYLVPRSCTAHHMSDEVMFIDVNRYSEKLDGFVHEYGSHNVEIRLGFENRGARVITASIVGHRFSLVGADAQILEGINRGWIRYVYDHSRKGRSERFKFRFQTLDGFKLTHVYETVHGKPVLRRIRPA